MVSGRGLAVLHAIVGDYVASNEPVGSKTIVDRYQFGVSAATIRNDMALLEEEELIAAPYTSSGRVPTDKGYRLYVDTLAKIRPLSASQRTAIERFLGEATDLDQALARAVRLLSQLTNQLAVVQYPSLKRTQVRHLDLVTLGEDRVLCVLILGTGVVEQQLASLPAARITEAWVNGVRDRIAGVLIGRDLEAAVRGVEQLAAEVDSWAQPGEVELVKQLLDVLLAQLRANRSERITIAGAANLSRAGEFSGSLSAVLAAIEEQVTVLQLFSELAGGTQDVSASIGRENLRFGLEGTAVLASSYEHDGDSQSHLGVLGPIRMDYAGNIASVRAVASYLSKLLAEG